MNTTTKKRNTFGLSVRPPETSTWQTLNVPEPVAPQRIDHRTLRKKGRDAQFNVYVTPTLRAELARTAKRARLTQYQLLVMLLRAYQTLPPERQQQLIQEVVDLEL